jgi:hypothetical protein
MTATVIINSISVKPLALRMKPPSVDEMVSMWTTLPQNAATGGLNGGPNGAREPV